MAKRKSEEPEVEIKVFSPDELEKGITKLKKRMAAVKTLQSDQVRHDDQRVKNEMLNIRDTILEVFGPNSPEYRAHRYHSMYPSIALGGTPDRQSQQEFEENVVDSLVMLQGLVDRLEEKRQETGHDSTSRIKASFEGMDLHARISSVCADLYRDGHYRNAVQDSAIALVNMVKEKSRRHDLDGSSLMTTVFSKNNPILAFNDLNDQTDRDEQEGMMHLFVGAVMALRNPRSHSLMADDAEQALEYIGFLSLLAKRVEETKRI